MITQTRSRSNYTQSDGTEMITVAVARPIYVKMERGVILGARPLRTLGELRNLIAYCEGRAKPNREDFDHFIILPNADWIHLFDPDADDWTWNADYTLDEFSEAVGKWCGGFPPE